MKKFLSMLGIAVSVALFTGCDDQEASPDGPVISTSGVSNVELGSSVDVAFNVTIPGEPSERRTRRGVLGIQSN